MKTPKTTTAKKSAKNVSNCESIKEQVNEPAKKEVIVENKVAAKPRRVETRDMWTLIFDKTAELLAKVSFGDNVPENYEKDLPFGKIVKKDKNGGYKIVDFIEDGKKRKLTTGEQEHTRPYAESLLAGFASPKARKIVRKAIAAAAANDKTLSANQKEENELLASLQSLNLDEIAMKVFTAKYKKATIETLLQRDGKQEKALLLAVAKERKNRLAYIEDIE